MRRIRERSMRNAPRAAVIDRVIALDEQRLVGPLRILEVPSVAWIRLDGERLALAVWVDQRSGDKVAFRHGVGVCEGERVSEDRLDGAPNLQQW